MLCLLRNGVYSISREQPLPVSLANEKILYVLEDSGTVSTGEWIVLNCKDLGVRFLLCCHSLRSTECWKGGKNEGKWHRKFSRGV